MGVRRREKVYIEEDRDYEPDTRSMVFTGTFSSMDWEPDCRGLSADEAIAWARERADVVLVLVGDGQCYAAGAVNPGYAPQWPPRNVDLLGRRPHGELRSADDPPIDYEISIYVVPPRWDRILHLEEKLDGWRATAADIARRADADDWSAEPIERFAADVEQGRRAGGSFTTSSPPAFELRFCEHAATASAGIEQARARVELPPEWRYGATTARAHVNGGRA
jgi:hypothetical protein